MTTTLPPKIHTSRASGKVNGTCLQGYMKTTYQDLCNRLGPALEGSADGKTTAEWVLEFGDGTVATIYDWKTGKTPQEPYAWHIGGRSERAVELVGEALNLSVEISNI